MHLFSQGNTDIHDSGILGDQFGAVGDHLLGIAFRKDQCTCRRFSLDLTDRSFLYLIRMQLEDQLPARCNFNAVADKSRPVFLP